MSNVLSRLNGWQRMWFVFSIICFVVVTIFVMAGQTKPNAVEDEAIIAKLNSDEVTRAQIFIPEKESKAKGPWDKYQTRNDLPPLPLVLFGVSSGETFIESIRAAFPEYADMSDSALSRAIRKKYPTIETVAFPNDASESEIRRIVVKYNDIDSIRNRATKLIAERNEKQAEQARNENNQIRKYESRLIEYGYGSWLVFVVSLYLLGFGIGWIYHGFKRADERI